MDKIISLKTYCCGKEEFDFSALYKSCRLGVRQLPVNAFLLEHKKYGIIMVNTGCSLRLKNNQNEFARLTNGRKLIFGEKDSLVWKLKEDGFDPIAVKKVLLTHCDPECCGALPALPKYELISTARVLSVLMIADPDDGIMKSTLPDSRIPRRAAGLFEGASVLRGYFKWIFDVFGDGSVLAVDLTGHSVMAGFYLPEKKIFFGADASIDETAVNEKLKPSDKLLSMQQYPKDYQSMLKTLQKMHIDHPEITFLFSHSPNPSSL